MSRAHLHAYNIYYAKRSGLERPRRNVFTRLFVRFVTAQAFIWNVFVAGIVFVGANLIGKRTSFSQALWTIGRSRYHHSSPFVDLFSTVNHTMKVDATRQPALDLCYHWDAVQERLQKERRFIELWFARIFFGPMANRRALINRRVIVVRTLMGIFRDLRDDGVKDITMISIASGSADAVIEAVRRARDEDGIRVDVTLIDLDEEALRNALAKAKKHDLLEQFHVKHGTARRTFLTLTDKGGLRPHVVEMVGFLDYRNDRYVIDLSRDIRERLRDRGHYLTCNIAPNDEKAFLDWVLLWLMPFYRTEKEFADLIVRSGFAAPCISVIRDPYFHIHTQIHCRKGCDK